jgi:hypothetical protein
VTAKLTDPPEADAAAAIAVIAVAAIAIFRCHQTDIPKVIEASGS